MKKILTLILTVLLTVSVPLSTAAATADVSTYIADLRQYYLEKDELTLVEETLAMASMGMLTGKTAFIPEKDGTALSLALRILAYGAVGELPEEETEQDEQKSSEQSDTEQSDTEQNDTEQDNSDKTKKYTDANDLKEMQGENGSFGDVETHCLAMMALSSRDVIYASTKAYEHLLTLQNEDGSFGESVKETALAVCVLSFSKNDKETEALAEALAYLVDYEADNAVDLSWKIIGITDGGMDANTVGDRDLLETLLSYQNENDHSYYLTSSANQSDDEATVMALAALDAMSRDGSMFKRLTENGELSFYNAEDAKPLIYFGIGLLVVSVAFWIFIFLHKKSNKTLEETKTY